MSPENSPSGDMSTGSPGIPSIGAHQPVILVADDQVTIRNLVTILLQREGYIVLSASDGHEGLELSRRYSGKIELGITDLEMPRLDGPEWVRAVRATAQVMTRRTSRPSQFRMAGSTTVAGYIVRSRMALLGVGSCVVVGR